MQGIGIPSYDQRAVFVGKTGCGKTTLAERVCGQFDNVVVLDSKGELTWKGYIICKSLAEVFRAGNEKIGKIIWQPNPHEQNEDTYNIYFKWIYDRRHTISYVDEVFAICKNSQNIPFWFRAILTRGRSRGIGSFNATQAPVFVPHFILSQSEHYYVFRTKLRGDRDKIEQITGIPYHMQNDLLNHEFYYANDNDYFPKKIKLKVN